MKTFILYLLYIIPSKYFNFEKKIISYFSFAFQILKGSNFKTRTKNRSDINFLRQLLNSNPQKRLAVFVAYHEPDILSQSNLNYLKSEEFHIELLNKLEENFPAEIYFQSGFHQSMPVGLRPWKTSLHDVLHTLPILLQEYHVPIAWLCWHSAD